MRHPHSEAPVALTAGSRDRLASEPGALFVYGTLQFPTVLEALIGRIPSGRPTAAPGWRAAALERRVYPGLVAAPGATATGLLMEDLTPTEWKILDDFEDDRYDLREITLAEGLTGWACVWPDGEVLPYNWQADYFADRHLTAYTARFKARVAQRESPAC
ncbi:MULTISPECIES: gamma-glutamylcyclotransferase family protein [unclassified Streptomyces]|uniref:gamma-glutamylcyclotransferase family protein n=1 Tax=unclassified Streptomyces TaxID=2593676 RepID=UPI002E82265A|nr:gamma-glutamylcyclotransferase family protein [Streptomyces sp. NBC_00589]WTI42358.1 gamma-glutamylcyclotransferase [Streptomyces sp. NBC_00775]WUB23960.1 gamma-glutamylcyclotransferase [Streptomyces sp. NBC_00589]